MFRVITSIIAFSRSIDVNCIINFVNKGKNTPNNNVGDVKHVWGVLCDVGAYDDYTCISMSETINLRIDSIDNCVAQHVHTGIF